MIYCRHRILPYQVLTWYFRSQVAGLWAHIPVSQLKPGLLVGFLKLFRIFQEMPRDLLIGRIHPQGKVGDQHERVIHFVRVVRIRHGPGPGSILGLVLPGSCRALGQLPFVSKEVFQVFVTPLDGGIRPGTLQPAGNGVGTFTCAKITLPAHALLLDRCSCRFRFQVLSIAGRTVGLPEGMPSGNQRNGLVVIHGHPSECLTDVMGGSHRIRVCVGSFGVHVNEPHMGSPHLLFELSAFAVPVLVSKPFSFRTPVNVLLGLIDILTPSCKSVHGQPHGLVGDIPGQDQQVCPGEFPAVFLLDGP